MAPPFQIVPIAQTLARSKKYETKKEKLRMSYNLSRSMKYESKKQA